MSTPFRTWLVLAAAAVASPAWALEGESRLLLAAAGRGDVARVAALLADGADSDAATASGWSALHAAAEAGSVETVRALLDAGAAPDPRDRVRGTPLDVAERAGRGELARLLRAKGARGSGKSIGDTVCVRPWDGAGFCGVVEARDATRHRLRVSEIVGCESGCDADPRCSAGNPVGPGGLDAGDALWVPTSCLTHTGVR